MTNSTVATKPVKAKKTTAPKLTTVAPATNKTPEAAKPAQAAKRTRKPAAAKPVVVADPVAPVAVVPVAAPVVATPVKKGAGRPLSSEAAKVRRRVVGAFVKLAAAGEIEVTVKATAKTVKLKKSTVSNTIRWAEAEGILTRIGYKLKSGPGRKEVFYTINAAMLAAEAAKAA